MFAQKELIPEEGEGEGRRSGGSSDARRCSTESSKDRSDMFIEEFDFWMEKREGYAAVEPFVVNPETKALSVSIF